MSQEEAISAAGCPSVRMLMRRSRQSRLQHLRLPWLMTLPSMCAAEFLLLMVHLSYLAITPALSCLVAEVLGTCGAYSVLGCFMLFDGI